ncbi:cytohesin-1-like isoform X2 [Dendronephthya gigantea]|uniref:cytohesin-1-like isoform X2 n=1 Tax=Dendronephthya gigantea TaxID=151771 RepID=UPI00106932E7|nr:cytohesin-1-like isoform X2 [Dendronephthya gigantea]
MTSGEDEEYFPSQLKSEINEVQSQMEAVEQPDEGTNSKQLAIGRKKFNMDPKKGIEYLIANDLLNDTPEDIAKFLLEEDGLNKTMIGDYLGENKEPMLSVLQHFVQLQNFKDLLLVEALRTFLWSFRLPGEAQKIDRMMECFAKKYCDQNEGVFTSTDTCYVLSFSIIMLNTSLHNPSVKDKPTVDKFISMNRGINCGGDLPKDLLISLYENIKKEAFKVPEDDGSDITRTFFNPDNEGYLTKEGGHHKNWKKRYFILKDNCLYYFKDVKDKEPRGIIPLENLQVREINSSKPFCFEISASEESGGMIKACKTDSEGKVVEGRHESYKISCETEKERAKWMKCIKASMVMDPFYDFLQARKKKATQKLS